MQLKPDMDSFKCDYCQCVYLPEKNGDGVRVLGEPSGQDCPVCKAPLQQAALAKVRIVYCPGCRGMLIPIPALEPLVEELKIPAGTAIAQPAADSSDLKRRVNCPRCHRPMDAHFYAGPGNVVIDSCEECLLLWLDHGKLMRLVAASKAEQA
jgi:Zn-finger nucleic acid-binding protein